MFFGLSLNIACQEPHQVEAGQATRAPPTYAEPDKQGRIPTGDGHYVLQSAVQYDGPAEFRTGAVTWQLEGPAEFEFSPTFPGPVTLSGRDYSSRMAEIRTARQKRVEEHGNTFVGAKRVDAAGIQWVAVAVDEQEFLVQVESYNALIRTQGTAEPAAIMFADTGGGESAGDGGEPDTGLANDNPDWEPAEGEFLTFTPQTWTANSCTFPSGVTVDEYRWNTESRNQKAISWTTRHKKTALVSVYLNGNTIGSCTGTFIDDNHVLTAAHCVSTAAGATRLASNLRVCSLGNYLTGAQCTEGVAAVARAPDWESIQDWGEDWAVIEIADSLGQGNWMALSQTSNSTITSSTIYTSGFPGMLPYQTAGSCTRNTGPSSGPVNTDYIAKYLYVQSGSIVDTTWRGIKGRHDSASGHSGAAYYYYPGGCCGAHYIVGVVAGFLESTGSDDYQAGPKVPKHRNDIIAAMGG